MIYILLQLQKAPHTQLQLHLECTSQEVYNYFKQVLVMKKQANHVASCYKHLVSACAQSTTAGLAYNTIKINEVAHLKTCTQIDTFQSVPHFAPRMKAKETKLP